MTIESICNQALDEIGYSRHIGNIYEGSKAARAFLNTWVETRDALLEKMQPDWAKRDAVLTLIKQAPSITNGMASYPYGGWTADYPPIPWLYEYQYPADCLTPLQIKESPIFLPVWRPRYNSSRTNYEITGSARTILSNVANAVLIYVASVGNPDNWEHDFTELMIAALAKKIEAGLMPARPQRQQQEAQQNANTAS